MATIKTIITPEDVRRLAPGVEANIALAGIQPYIQSAHKIIAISVGVEVFNEIASGGESELLEHLQSAVANRLMYDYKLFETISRRQSQKQDTYKYELELMQKTYMSLSFDALDSVFAALNADYESIKSWASSDACNALKSLLIPTTEEFNSYYGIDGSHYFFFSVIFLQRTVIDNHLSGISIDILDEGQMRRVKSIAATFTVAYALRQFDITMLPKSWRNSAADGATRAASSEQDAMYKLSEHLFDRAEKELSKLIFELNAPEPGQNVQSTQSLNKESSKFFHIS